MWDFSQFSPTISSGWMYLTQDSAGKSPSRCNQFSTKSTSFLSSLPSMRHQLATIAHGDQDNANLCLQPCSYQTWLFLLSIFCFCISNVWATWKSSYTANRKKQLYSKPQTPNALAAVKPKVNHSKLYRVSCTASLIEWLSPLHIFNWNLSKVSMHRYCMYASASICAMPFLCVKSNYHHHHHLNTTVLLRYSLLATLLEPTSWSIGKEQL